MTEEVTQAIRDSLLTFWAAGSSAARQNKEASPQAFDREAARLMALITTRANQPPAQDGLVEALETIEAEMAFPNSLERGFVHRGPTLADMQKRVELAQSISRAALSAIKGDKS